MKSQLSDSADMKDKCFKYILRSNKYIHNLKKQF